VQIRLLGIFRRHGRASGVSGWWLHDLRRTLATGLQRLGARSAAPLLADQQKNPLGTLLQLGCNSNLKAFDPML